MKIALWFRIIRPQTLFASLCPVLVALITMSEPINTVVATVTAICAVALQVLSNLINDYYDYRRGTDKQGRVGFRRALAEGEVSERQMFTACLITLAVCIVCGAFLVWTGGIVILLIGLSALLFAWLYTATPYSLSYLGIADIFVFLYYGVIASLGTHYLQTGTFSMQIFYAGAVCGLISMCVLMINNLRDMEDDRAVGKSTLMVRFGKRAGHALLFTVVLLMPVMAYLAHGLSLPMLIIIPGTLLFRAVTHAQGTAYNKCLLFAGITNVIYTILAAMHCIG